METLKLVIFAVIHYALVFKVESLCHAECSCRNEPTSCPLGVRLGKDGCDCCNICTRQYGEYCDDEYTCDSEMGLVCDFAAAPGEKGVCKMQIARSCSYNGVNHLNGEMFHPTCKHRCWCMDGAVGCLSLCPHETRVPLSHECPNARLQSVEGECCQRWVCGRGGNVRMLPLDQFWDRYVDKSSDLDASDATLPEGTTNALRFTNPSAPGLRYPEADRQTDDSESMENFLAYDDDEIESTDDELVSYGDIPSLVHKGSLTQLGSQLARGYEGKDERTTVDAVAFTRSRGANLRASCAVQTTSWTPCSKSCGLGVSTRVTNNNRGCELRSESRLCNIRPCNDVNYSVPKKGKQCTRHKRERRRTYVRYSNCKSIRPFKHRYCGGCDDGRCCTPHATRTVKVRFRCENGVDLLKNMMMIRTCRCDNKCSLFTENSFLVSRDVRNDMLKSTEQ